jgi:hypothetical protein
MAIHDTSNIQGRDRKIHVNLDKFVVVASQMTECLDTLVIFLSVYCGEGGGETPALSS